MGSSSKLLKLTILFCAALGLRGDSITTYTLTASDNHLLANGSCGYPCQAELFFEIPQSEAPLSDLSFTFTDNQFVQWGYNDMYDTDVGAPFTITTTISAQSTDLPIESSFINSFNGSISGTRQISGGFPFSYTDTLTAQGSATDLSPFEGSGVETIGVWISGRGALISQPDSVSSLITGLSDRATLTITETDPPNEIPEPHTLLLTLVVIVGYGTRRYCGAVHEPRG